jgi:hypothetical protein
VGLVDQTARGVDNLDVRLRRRGFQFGVSGDELRCDTVKKDLLTVSHVLLKSKEEVKIALAGVLQAI